MTSPIQSTPASPTFTYGAATPLLDVAAYRFNGVTGRSYDLSLDDQRFLMILRPAQAGEDRTISIVTQTSRPARRFLWPIRAGGFRSNGEASTVSDAHRRPCWNPHEPA
jgi:hypothetical protein